jgi:bacterioferritin-associated ferredoxin
MTRRILSIRFAQSLLTRIRIRVLISAGGNAMYVCVCNAVTDCQIREAFCEGACSMRMLREKLGVAGCCGRCAPCAKDVLAKCRQEFVRQQSQSSETVFEPLVATG